MTDLPWLKRRAWQYLLFLTVDSQFSDADKSLSRQVMGTIIMTHATPRYQSVRSSRAGCQNSSWRGGVRRRFRAHCWYPARDLERQRRGGNTGEVELNQVAINRIGAAAGSIAREVSQQILRGHGSNFPWGSVNVWQRLPTIGRTALAYSVLTGLNGAFSQFVPESMRSWISPMMDWNNYP
ncbi:hypothetical protein PS934_03039 [Pseudomonas fluorescens]|nr:hypothetical protein PS934_03039 [Pseudomonas fluorescens]